MTALADFSVAQAGPRAYGEPGSRGPGPAAVPGPVPAAGRSGAVRDQAKTMRSWPLLVLAVPAAAEVWSGWVGIAQKTGFGVVPLLPGIWSSLHLDTAVTLAGRGRVLRGLRAACLAGQRARDQRPDPAVRPVVSDLLVRARHGRAGRVPPDGPGPRHPGALGHHHPRVLPPGPGPGHGDRPGPHAARGRRSGGPAGRPVRRTGRRAVPGLVRRGPARGPSGPASGSGPGPDQDQPDQVRDQQAGTRTTVRTSPSPRTSASALSPGSAAPPGAAGRVVSRSPDQGGVQASLIALKLATAGKPVSRRALRNGGVKGSNESLNALARQLNAEFANEQAAVP